MKWFFVAIAVLTLSITSCENDNKTELLSQIDQMENTLDSLETIVKDTAGYSSAEMIASVRATILKVKTNYVADTIDYDLAEQMNSYKDIRKGISKNSGNLAKAKQTIPEVQQKLSDLRHDIENGVNDRDKYQEFINFEQSKVHEIEEVLRYYVETNEKYHNTYDELHPIIKQLGDSLVNAKNE
ncbi:hypothetical protein [Brumimicrobium oceani]|nr:hypothetical protein [Brumimicrobium oceani]